uniref:hypothetical protein n=1 Tax=Gelidibacter sp. TaxID=2018083 RepID=UPI00404A4A2B
MFINTFGFAQEIPKEKPVIPVTPTKDTTTVSIDSLLGKPINIKEGDSITNDSVPKKKDFLEDIVKYKAKDYVSMNQRLQKIFLY